MQVFADELKNYLPGGGAAAPAGGDDSSKVSKKTN